MAVELAWRDGVATQADLAAAIGRHVAELVAAMAAKGYGEASVGIVLSATHDSPTLVGLHLWPTRGQSLSVVDVGLTESSLAWARHEIARLPPRAEPAPAVA